MKEITIINDRHFWGGFISGREGIWTRNTPSDPPTADYIALGIKLGVPLSRMIRPYQAGGCKVAVVGFEHGGAGIVRDNDLKKVDGLVTAEKGIVLSIIAADCVPVYLADEEAGVIGLLHCGWRSAAGDILCNCIRCMEELGASTAGIKMFIGPHICAGCYEVGEDVRSVYSEAFTAEELSSILYEREGRLYLDLAQALRIKASEEGIMAADIMASDECTCHDNSYYSYRRGDRERQDLAFLMMR
ncbi:MAG: laccase domain-containing protein [Ruminococcus sp.]|nr:laccase domain-containing protein [Ruminococcus sp.]